MSLSSEGSWSTHHLERKVNRFCFPQARAKREDKGGLENKPTRAKRQAEEVLINLQSRAKRDAKGVLVNQRPRAKRIAKGS